MKQLGRATGSRQASYVEPQSAEDIRAEPTLQSPSASSATGRLGLSAPRTIPMLGGRSGLSAGLVTEDLAARDTTAMINADRPQVGSSRPASPGLFAHEAAEELRSYELEPQSAEDIRVEPTLQSPSASSATGQLGLSAPRTIPMLGGRSGLSAGLVTEDLAARDTTAMINADRPQVGSSRPASPGLFAHEAAEELRSYELEPQSAEDIRVEPTLQSPSASSATGQLGLSAPRTIPMLGGRSGLSAGLVTEDLAARDTKELENRLPGGYLTLCTVVSTTIIATVLVLGIYILNGGSQEIDDGSGNTEPVKSVLSNPWVIVSAACIALLLVLAVSLFFLRKHIATKQARHHDWRVQPKHRQAITESINPDERTSEQPAAKCLEMLIVWIGVAIGALALPFLLTLAFYFGLKEACLVPNHRDWHAETETFIGSLPALSRTAVVIPGLSWVATTLVKSGTGFSEWPTWCPGRNDGRDDVDVAKEIPGLSEEQQQKVKEVLRKAERRVEAKHRSLVMILLLGQGVEADELPRTKVDWERIAGQNADFPQAFIAALPEHQKLSTWQEARETLGLTELQAKCIGAVKLLLWHWSQPIIYAWVFYNYFCKLTTDGQKFMGAIVAAREVVYIISTLVALKECPVFLLLDLSTVWRNKKQRMRRLAAYVLTPHIFVSLCIAQRHPNLRRMFIPLTAFEILADFASCFALGVLLSADPLMEPVKERIPLLIGYCITSFGFILFFAPVTIGELYRYAKETNSNLATFASGLLSVALVYIVVGALLMLFDVDIYCNDYTLFFKTECQHGGRCYSGNCDCARTGYRGGVCEVADPCSRLRNASNACCAGSSCGVHWNDCTKGHCECASDYILATDCRTLCVNGDFVHGVCNCAEGWSGVECDEITVDSDSSAIGLVVVFGVGILCCCGVGYSSLRDSWTVRWAKNTLHLLNLIDLVLGLFVGLFGLLLFLKWQMMSLIWLWAPLIGIGGVSVLLVFTSECGVYASKNCGCLVSLSNMFGLIVGGIELVAAMTIAAAKDWVKIKVVESLMAEMRQKCQASADEAACTAIGIGSRTACTWTPGGTPYPCTLTETPESSIDEWLKWTMIALFGLVAGQLIRLLSSHVFRRATRDQVDIADFADPFLANDSYDRWSKYSADYRDPDQPASSRRDRWGN